MDEHLSPKERECFVLGLIAGRKNIMVEFDYLGHSDRKNDYFNRGLWLGLEEREQENMNAGT
eukprot:4647217-Pyramimonas_sp.AAC.1